MVGVLESYRTAAALAGARQWTKAIAALQALLRDHPDFADGWREMGGFALEAGRNELAVDAYKHVIALESEDVAAQLGAAEALVRLRRYDDAHEHADAAAAMAAPADTLARSSAHEWLARIALARHDAAAAREEADLAREADASLPLPQFVEGRLLYDRARYAEALPFFEQAAAGERASHSRPIAGLHFYLGDTLARLDRAAEAEGELDAELKTFPSNTRARAALADLLHAAGRDSEAADAIEDLVRISPTADAYNLAARLWTSLGDKRKAAESRSAALAH